MLNLRKKKKKKPLKRAAELFLVASVNNNGKTNNNKMILLRMRLKGELHRNWSSLKVVLEKNNLAAEVVL